MPPSRKLTPRIDKRNGVTMELRGDGPVEPFDPPDNLCAEALSQWEAYWGDPVSSSPTAADRGVLLRWIESLHRYLTYQRAADEEPLTRGSQGQWVKNPLHALAADALAVVERCEKQMGIGGKNRADLGIAIVTGQRSLAELNSKFQESHDNEGTSAEEDPRVTPITQAKGKANRPRG